MTAREELTLQCHALAAAGLSPGASGNVSLRIGDRVLVSPSGTSLARTTPGSFVEMKLDGTILSLGVGDLPPSKEATFHLALYQARPAAQAVVHLHSVPATTMSVLLAEHSLLPERTLYHPMRLGRVAIVPAFAPGSAELAQAIAALAPDHHALLLARHGSVVAGTSLPHAAELAEELDAACQVELLIRR